MPANVQKHEMVYCSAKEWVRGDVHTGTIDGYRLSECQFRWNNRKAQRSFYFLRICCMIVYGEYGCG